MRQWEFKKALKIRLDILKANTIFSFREGLAYVYNNWGGLASTMTYMLTYLVFLSIIYSRVDMVAGYNYAEMLLFTFVGQLSFYLTWMWSFGNIVRLGQDVNSGKLDLILSKPLPALWYITFQRIDLPMLVFQGFPALLPLLFLMSRNTNFTVFPLGVVWAIITFILGQIAIHCFMFILGLAVFWTGQNKSIAGLGYNLMYFGDAIPLQAYPGKIIVLGLTAVPFLTHISLTPSYLLGKTTNLSWLGLLFVTTAVFVWGKIKLWNLALRHHSSASS